MKSKLNNIKEMNNQHSPQTIEHKKKTTIYGVGNPGFVLGQAQKCDELNQLMRS